MILYGDIYLGQHPVGGAFPLWESVGMCRDFAPHFRHLADNLFAPQNLTMSTILFRSCWVPFQKPPIFTTWCLMTPSHYLKQCWFLICEVPWHLPESILTASAQATLYNEFKNYTFTWLPYLPVAIVLTHWGRVTHICVSKLNSIGLDNGLSSGRCQAIIWTDAGILLIWPLGTNFREMFIEIHTFSFKKIYLKMSSGKWRPFCPGLNVLMSLTTAVSHIQGNLECRCRHW